MARTDPRRVAAVALRLREGAGLEILGAVEKLRDATVLDLADEATVARHALLRGAPGEELAESFSRLAFALGMEIFHLMHPRSEEPGASDESRK